MFDPDAWRARQPSQFPSWLSEDLGLAPDTIDTMIRRPSVWNRIRRFVASRRRDSDAIAVPQPLPVGRSDRADRDESAAA
jgi:hypothetical protein